MAPNVQNYINAWDNIPKESVEVIFEAIKEALSDKERKLLIHREYLDEEVPGVLAGYLIYSKLTMKIMEVI